VNVKEGIRGDMGTLSLTIQQEETSKKLRQSLSVLAKRVQGSTKLNLSQKVTMLASLVKSHESLTKTERAVAGLDRKDVTTITAGVIIVPGKADADSWAVEAEKEINAVANKLGLGDGTS